MKHLKFRIVASIIIIVIAVIAAAAALSNSGSGNDGGVPNTDAPISN
jgi:hypothetical protein